MQNALDSGQIPAQTDGGLGRFYSFWAQQDRKHEAQLAGWAS